MPYYRAKWEMEQAVASPGLEHVIFRPSFVFGRDGGVLPTFIRQVRYVPVTPVIGRARPAAADLDRRHGRVLRRAYQPEAADARSSSAARTRVSWNEFWSG